ncbi:unnamed protein product [Rotaria magnacalcarata]|uniref:Hemicentin-1-like von Willebrand factor A domain-containing protein n=1 Tax=Rotaria magnacalcarata TaxID=392030 RepID=A0A8S2KA15_9BILA|nr:unnamed protein product [Rotaria magnacalcarata]
MNTANEAKINSESTEIHRLFYVEDDNFSNGDEYKMAIDYQNMPKIVENLRQLDVQKAKIFGIFGDDMDVTKFLYSLFPDGQNKIESLFSNCDRMPTIWTIFNNIDLVFLLICNQDLALEKGNYFTVVMQRFLQDICHNIIICPSETFFTNFSTEHSFHGKPHGSRTYKLVKKELVDIQTPKNIKLDDKNIFKLVLDESCQNVLSTNNSPTTYCVRKIVQETNQTTANNRFNELKELLQKYFDIGTANLRTIFKLCDETRIFLSIKQKAKIEKVITDHVQLYNNQTAHIDHEVKSFINELIGKGKILSSLRHDTEKEIRKKLYEITKSWLIEPKHSKTTAEDCTEYLIGSLENHFKNKPSKFNITDEHRSEFISRMKKNDKKNEVRDLQELCIKFIILEAQSENQFDVHFDIHPLHYIPEFDTEHHLQHISVNSSAPIKITFNELNTFMNLSVLSESDRLALPRRIKLIACYRTSDGKSEIIIINRPNIVNERLSENDGYSILLHKNGFFKKIPDYSRFGIHLAYASSQNSQTLVFYHKTTGEVSRWSVNESGELKSHTILHQLDKSNQPSGVKSLALTAAQDLLILIDSTSTVYSIDISNETNAVTLLLYKTTNSSINQRDFMTNDGELYDNVQTIGEKNPIFFFQAKNCIDIIDQNYCQMFSIKLIHNAQFYKMQIFTDFFDTYCVLFNSQVNEVYCIQNLISDTRIERQESSNNLAESSQQYIDLGFSRFQDRLFALLSQAVEKISKSEKLFKGILLVAIRDISDNINKESFEAAENKFLDLQSRGKSGFLEQLFSNTFQIQLLHHYENRNFDHEVRGLRQLFFNYINTESQISRRWENGKTLADRLKILLVQLYTDDFIDSDEIHCEMKLVELIERMKKAWTTFDLNDEENIEINEQIIETTFNDKQYSIKLNHKKLYLEENASNQNFDNMCEFILNQLYPQNDSTTETDEEMNKIQVFVDKLIPEIMSYRSQQVKKWMIENFKQEFPIENNNIKDMKTKFLSTIEQYMRSFKLQICLKKCSICYLKCIKNSQHTQETKSLLEQKKEELKHILTSFEITDLKNIREHMEELNQKICTASANENNLRQRMNLLSIELKDLIEKEKIETQNDEYDSKIAIENEKIHGYHQKINDIYQQLKTLLPNNDLQDMNKLRQELDAELLLIIDPNQYNSDQLQTLVDLFHKNYKNGDKPKTDLLHWSIDGETIGITELIGHCQHQTPLFLAMMNKNIDQIFHYSIFIENNLKHIGKQLDEYKENLNNVETKINELKQKQINVQQETENTMKLIKENEIEEEEVAKEINDIKIQQETLSKTIYDDHQTNDTMNQLIHKKIQHYIENLKDKRNKIVHSHIYNDHETLETNKEKAVKTLQFLLDEKDQKERIITDYRKEMEETPDDHNRIHQCREEINSNEKTVKTIVEKLNRVQTKINSIETDQLLLEKMDEELYQIDQLKQSLHSSDERIQSKQKRLSQCLERVNKQKIEIKTLEEDDPDDFIEQEKQKLEKLNKQYDGLSTELNELEQQNLALYNNNTLLCKILNEQEFDLDKQNQILQDRHDELSKSLENLNEKNACILNNLSSNKAKLNEQNQQLSNISKELDDQNIAYGNCKEIVQFNGELNVSGNTLFESLNNVKNLLNTNLKRLNEIFQANTLIDDNAALSNAFKSADEELARLKTVRDQLSKQLDEITGNNRSFNFVNSQKCNEEYQSVIRKHKAASSLNENLKQQKLDSSIYSRLSKEISCLEKEAQNHCDCGTDHKCSGMCQICAAETITKQNLCMFKAGHNGEHKCDSGHICTKFCDICQFYDMPTSRCQFVYGHKEPERHQCEGTHQCPITCICSDPCATPLDLTQHKIHRCNKKDCWKPCMFPCGNLCATEDHNHDMTTESVTISIGRETRQMKKHLCDQSHYCQGICDAPGVCQQEYKTQQRKWKTESGEEFEYQHIEVQKVRGKCGVVIPAGKSSHDDTTSHQCDGHEQHTCQERCPDCGSFCRNRHGHKGFHRTLHRNKDLHVFTSTNPTDTIEIRSSESQETDARKYKVGESAKPENCSVSCKRRGRSHFHLVECPGGVGCLGKVLGNRAKHSDAAYYYGPDQPSPKQFDEILCSTYWSQHKWLPPVDNEADLKLINLCNAYCKDHVIREKNVLTAQDGAKGFCTSDAWHIGNHVFQCQADHSTLEMYQGIDVCFVIDTTGSMDKYFEKVKQAIIRIVNDNQTFLAKIKSKCDFQFAIVDYRDHEPEGDYIYHKCDFTNHTAAMDYVMNLKSGSGGDLPEAVLDGLDAACALNWRKNADHLLFHILDAPPHGKIYTKRPDKWSNGCPCGKTAQIILQAMKNKKIAYHILPCSNEINMMIGEFKKHIEVKTLAFNDKITFEGAIAKQVLEHLIDTEITLKKT